MIESIRAVFAAVADLDPHTMVGALMAGLGVALAMAGLYELGKRRVSDPFPLLVGLMLLGCTASMALAAGYYRGAGGPNSSLPEPYNGVVFGGHPPGEAAGPHPVMVGPAWGWPGGPSPAARPWGSGPPPDAAGPGRSTWPGGMHEGPPVLRRPQGSADGG